jgi:RHS repeat-associated protein
VHQDPVNKSQRLTDAAGTETSRIELDPWGADTNRSSNAAFQPRKFTSYERDGNGSDEAMFRRYNRWHSRFDQPDPYDGSYSLADPQSFNRYAYVQNDPVNFVDPSGLDPSDPPFQTPPVPIDPETGRPYPGGVPNINAGVVTIGIGSFDGPIRGSVLGGDFHFEIELGNPEVGGGVDGGGADQDPLPTPRPSSHPAPDRSQQKQFDDCIAPAKNLYQGRLPGVAGKTIAGGAGLAAGIAVLKGAPSVGFGINAAAKTFAGPLTRTTLFHGLMEIKHAAWISTPINFLSGRLLVTGLKDLIGNRKAFEAALADCVKKWPLSRH